MKFPTSISFSNLRFMGKRLASANLLSAFAAVMLALRVDIIQPILEDYRSEDADEDRIEWTW